MGKKKIILIAVFVAAAVTAVLIFFGKNGDTSAVQIDSETPFSVSVAENSVSIKIKGSEEWEYYTDEDSALKVEKKENNTFSVTCSEVYMGDVYFSYTAEDGTVYINTAGLGFSDSGISVMNAFSSKLYGETSFCEDTELPVKCTPEIDGSADILITKNTDGVWETECGEKRSVTEGVREDGGISFTVTAEESGEFSVTFSNVTLGLSCKVVFEADENLLVFAKSAAVGECEIKADDTKDRGKTETENALVKLKENFTAVNIAEDLKISSASYDETAEGKSGMLTAAFSKGGFTLNMKNYALGEGFGYDYTAYEKTSSRINGFSVTVYTSGDRTIIGEWTSGGVGYRLISDGITETEFEQLITELFS